MGSRCGHLIARASLFGLALAALGADLGCSQLRSRHQAAEKPVATLGTELPGRDIYAQNIATPAGPGSSRTGLAEASAPLDSALADEATPPPVASPDEPTPDAPVVKLQPPVVIDPAKVGVMSTNVGVPDGARLIAASTPRARMAAPRTAASSPPIKPTTRVVSEARQALDRMSTYQLALRRQERVNGTLLPQEDLIMSIRRSPKAARLTWVDGPHKGREVLYRSDEPGGLMHVNMADSKLPVPRLALAPDSPLVMKNSRHPITEAGLDPIIASMEQADQAGGLSDLGMQTPSPLDHPHQGVLQRIPNGDIWRAYFEPSNHLPALVECIAGNGDLIESYQFRNIEANVPELASADAFDPNARWGPPRGLFGRAATRAADAGTPPTTR